MSRFLNLVTPLKNKIIFKSILHFFSFSPILFWSISHAQHNSITGAITDYQKKTLSHVTIHCSETGEYLTSDLNGTFSVQITNTDSLTFTFSHVGFRTHTERFSVHQPNIIIIILEPDQVYLAEYVVSENKIEKSKINNSGNFAVIDGAFLREQMNGTLINSLEKIPGIQSTNVGPSMSRPLIRGHSGYRIVFAKNSIRQEEQYWNAHQGISADQYTVEEVEIIKGPASLYYGSDAIGGVINIKNTSVPLYQGMTGEISFNYKSNNDLFGMNMNVDTRKKNLYLKFSASTQYFSDFRVPADSFEYKPMHYATLNKILVNTAGSETSLNLQAGFDTKNLHSSLLMSYYRHHSGFFAFAAGQELINADTAVQYISNRDIQLPSVNIENIDIYQITNIYKPNCKINIYAGVQLNTSAEYDHIIDITGFRIEDVVKYSENHLDLENRLAATNAGCNIHLNDTGKIRLLTGIHIQFQQNQTTGYSHLLPEYEKYSGGMYFKPFYRLNKKWMIETGIRADYSVLSIHQSLNPVPFLGDSVLNEAMKPAFPGVSLAAGIVYSNNKNTILKVHLGRSYRTPAVYELASYGIHRHNLRFEKGNPMLNPEVAYQADIVAEYNNRTSFFSISPFLCYFTNYIFLTPTPDFAAGTFTGQIYEYRQNRSLQYGTELMFRTELPYKLNISCGFEFVYSMNYDTRQAIPYTPPLSAIPELFYLHREKKFKLGIEAVIVASQKLTAINEQQTPGYIIYNLRASKTFFPGKHDITLHFAIVNITNKGYLNHLSYYRRLQIPEPGRNIQISISIPFKNLKNNL